MSISITVVLQKSAHGRSTLQAYQKRVGALLSVSALKQTRMTATATHCPRNIGQTIMYNTAAGFRSSSSDGTQHSEQQNVTMNVV